MRAERLILFIVIQLSIYSCQSDNKIVETWISYNWIESTDFDDYKRLRDRIIENKDSYSDDFLLHIDSMHSRRIDDKQIFQFSEDSLITTQFNETLYYGYDRGVFPYNQREDTILLFKDAEEYFSFKIEELRDDKLVLYYQIEEEVRSENRITFQPLKKFNCKSTLGELKSLFVDNTFLLKEVDTEITFYSYDRFNGKVTVNNSQNALNIETNHNWYIADVYNEMFLVIDSHLIQIITAEKNKIIGYMYGGNNSKILLEKVRRERKG